MSKFFYYCSMLGPIGHLPMAGTIASLIAYALFYALGVSNDIPELYAGAAIVGAICISYFIIDRALHHLDRNDDPREVVIDEVVGSLCALIFLPYSLSAYALSFLFFRFFDIVKPWPINKAELLFGAWGILLDDVLAGLFSGGVVYLLWHCMLIS